MMLNSEPALAMQKRSCHHYQEISGGSVSSSSQKAKKMEHRKEKHRKQGFCRKPWCTHTLRTVCSLISAPQARCSNVITGTEEDNWNHWGMEYLLHRSRIFELCKLERTELKGNLLMVSKLLWKPQTRWMQRWSSPILQCWSWGSFGEIRRGLKNNLRKCFLKQQAVTFRNLWSFGFKQVQKGLYKFTDLKSMKKY